MEQTNFYQKNKDWINPFILLCLISVFLSFFTRHFVLNENIVYQSLKEQLPTERIDQVMANRSSNEWINYLMIPIYRFILIIITSVVISTGVHLKDLKIPFKKILKVTVLSAFILLIPSIVKIIHFFGADFKLSDFQEFFPHSLLFYIDKSAIPLWFYYPVYLVNVVELFYWFALSYGIYKISSLNFFKSFLLIAQTYGVAMFVWVVFVVFIMINMS